MLCNIITPQFLTFILFLTCILVLDEFKEFRKTLSEPSKILINSLSDEKRNLEQITEINKAKLPGISNLLNSTAKQIYTSLIKPYSGTSLLSFI